MSKCQGNEISPDFGATSMRTPIISAEEVTNELYERQRRMCNGNIFNKPEKGNKELEKGRSTHKTNNKKSLSIVNWFRLGKENKNGNSKLKIILSYAGKLHQNY